MASKPNKAPARLVHHADIAYGPAPRSPYTGPPTAMSSRNGRAPRIATATAPRRQPTPSAVRARMLFPTIASMRDEVYALTALLERELDLPFTVPSMKEEFDTADVLRRELVHLRHLKDLQQQRDNPPKPEPRPVGLGLGNCVECS